MSIRLEVESKAHKRFQPQDGEPVVVHERIDFPHRGGVLGSRLLGPSGAPLSSWRMNWLLYRRARSFIPLPQEILR